MTLQQRKRQLLATFAAAGVVAAVAAPVLPTAAIAATTTDTVDHAGAMLLVGGPEKAKSVRSFQESVGVNVHFEYNDTPYGWNYTRVRQALVDSGIKHVRGGTLRSADLFRDNIKTNVVVDVNIADGSGTPATRWAGIAPLVRSGAVDVVEGPNEPDIYWINNDRTYKGQGFPAGALAWQQDLWDLAKSDPTTAGVTVVAPSLGRNYVNTVNPFPPGSLAPMSDWGSFHPYPGPNAANNGLSYAGLSKYYWQSDFPSISLDRYPTQLRAYAAASSPKPLAATETGYSTWTYGQSEKSVGKYMPRVFLENYRLGIPRTYSYELLDTFADPDKMSRDANYGLLRRDLTPKPAYNAVSAMMAAVKDVQPAAGAPRVGDTLDYTMSVTPPAGYDATYLHRVLLQKSDGTFVLALWHEVTANNAAAMGSGAVTEVNQPAMHVDLGLPAGATVTGKVLDESGQPVPAEIGTAGNKVFLDVPDRVTFLDITLPPPPPAGTVPAPGVSLAPVSLTALTATAMSNGYGTGPVERNRSVNSGSGGDGKPLTIEGQVFPLGFGTHAGSAMTWDLGGRYARLRTGVGIDDEVGIKGSTVFEVYGDGALLHRTPMMTGSSPLATIDVSLIGVRTLKLVATDGGDGINSDHADWVDPTLVSPPPTLALSSVIGGSVTNGWGPVEKDRSNGGSLPGDGRALTLNGTTYATGLGVHANASATWIVGGKWSGFSTVVGVDDEVGNQGSVVFEIWADDVLKYRSPVLTGASASIPVTVDIAGAQKLRLAVLNNGSSAYDHADWALPTLIGPAG